MAIIWVAASIVLIVGFGSFAVDYGRVSLAKSELQAAATAAARAAAANLPSGVTAAQNAAVNIAFKNNVDGAPLSLEATNDIAFGLWDDTQRKFTTLTGTARAGANAVRVSAGRTRLRGNAIQLVLGRVIGMAECDVNASAVARTSQTGFPFVGLDSVTIGGQGNTDSYDSALGGYSGSTKKSNGHVASNGNITVGGNGTVMGDAHPGIGGTLQIGSQANVSGSRAPLAYKLLYAAPVVPNAATYYGAVSVSNGNYDVQAGDYHLTSLSISNKATLRCLGPVRIFVSGPVNITGGYVQTYLNKPGNFQLLVTTSSTVSLTGQAGFYGQVYAPLSDVSQGGQADIYGTIVGRTLTFGGTWKGGAHADEAINNLGMGVILTTQ
jgi:Flp pilus assembly protein TadG